jgi:hypothetical protein
MLLLESKNKAGLNVPPYELPGFTLIGAGIHPAPPHFKLNLTLQLPSREKKIHPFVMGWIVYPKLW